MYCGAMRSAIHDKPGGRRLHVAAAQVLSDDGGDRTLERMDALCRAAALLGVEAMLFSETVVHGYDFDMTAASLERLAEPLDGPAAKGIMEMARRNNLTVLAGIFERDAAGLYNTHLVADPAGWLHVRRKHALTGAERNAGLRPGPRERVLFELNGVRCAILICSDAGIPGMPEDLRALGVQLRFMPAAGGGRIADMLCASDLATPEGRNRYEENRPRVCIGAPFDPTFEAWGSACVSANALGPAGARTCHQGHCIIVDAQGVLRAQAVGTIVREHMQEQFIHAVLTWP